MRNLILAILSVFSLMLFAQQKNTSNKSLLPSHGKLANYDYTESFSKESNDNLALLAHNMHLSLMAFSNVDSIKISRPIIYVNGKYTPIQSLTNYRQSDVANIDIEFIPRDTLTALYGTSALNGYGIIRIQLKETKE